jgi:hypothetical protein
VDISLHGNGTRFGGKELGGLQLAIPTVVNSGTYGGIARSNAIWRTSVPSTPTRSHRDRHPGHRDHGPPDAQQIMTKRSRGKQSADLMLMSAEHYAAYDAATWRSSASTTRRSSASSASSR